MNYKLLSKIASPDDIKSICEHVTCHCNDGAVADLIEYVIQNG